MATDAAADAARLQRWTSSLPAALAALRAPGADSYGPDGLSAVWAGVSPRLALSETMGVDPLDTRPGDVPEWAAQPGHRRERITMSLPTLHLVGHLGRYLGECLTQRVPAAEWVIWWWTGRASGTSGDGDPALTIIDPATRFGRRSSVFPLIDVAMAAQRVLSGSSETPDLAGVYERRVAELVDAENAARR